MSGVPVNCGPERKIRLDCDTGPDKDVYLIVRDKNVTPALAAGLTRTMHGGSSNQFNVRMTQNTGDIQVLVLISQIHILS